MKRLFDIIVSFVGLAVLAPVFAAVALLIWIFDGRPVFFLHQRCGRGGKTFLLYKFRTMSTVKNASPSAVDLGSTARVTKIGRLLRKTKLDELPQLLNVLKGDMSLVGPRPDVQEWIDVYPERWRKVHRVRPGITDQASIRFRNEEELLAASDDPVRMYREVVLPRKLDYYEAYVDNHTFWGDIVLILKTFHAVVFK